MSHPTPYADQESQAQTQPQPQFQSQSFLLGFFPWISLSISLLFVLIYYRKCIVSRCQSPRRKICSRHGLNGRIWGYRPVDGESDGDGDGADETDSKDAHLNADGAGYREREVDDRTSTTTPIADLRNKHELNLPETGVSSGTEQDSELTCNNDNKSDNSTENEGGGVSLSIAKYFDPTTGLLHHHVLEPPSPPWYSPRSHLGNYHDYAEYTDSEEDVDLDGNVEGAITFNYKENNGNHHAYSIAKADAGPGWVHSLVEMAVRGLETLHDTWARER